MIRLAAAGFFLLRRSLEQRSQLGRVRIPGKSPRREHAVFSKRAAELRLFREGTERLGQLAGILGIVEQQRINAVCQPFAHSRIAADHARQSAGQRLQDRQVERVLERGRHQDIRCSIESADVLSRRAKLQPFTEPQPRRLGAKGSFVVLANDQQI